MRTASEDRIDMILKLIGENTCEDGLTVRILCEIATQLARIATQLEKITSLKYTEDA